MMGWKIVRNGQREFCEEHGISGRWRVSLDPGRALMKKLLEEASEFAETMDPGELYDVRDVLVELIAFFDPRGTHEFLHAGKLARVGSFSDHLEWNPAPEGVPIDETSGNIAAGGAHA